MAARQMRGLVARFNLLVAMRGFADAFWTQLPLLFVLGTVLLVGGVVAKETVSNCYLKGLGRAAVAAGWKMMVLAAAIYLLGRGLGVASSGMPAA